MRVKHFRLETGDRHYLVALIPINFAKLADDRTADVGITTEGLYMIAIDDDAYVEADPYAWDSKDRDLVLAHFYLRDKVNELRGGQVLQASDIREKVGAVVEKLVAERNGSHDETETPPAK
ncbi:MAG: hypothetical protein AAB229_03650 [Candidatus Hydrogenedentota bacterium]